MRRRWYPLSMNLFEIAATAFLVVLTLSWLVFAAKYIRTRAKGRGPFGMFSQLGQTFAQYDDEGEGKGSDTGGDSAKTGRNDSQNSS
jgi:hypothetical protein